LLQELPLRGERGPLALLHGARKSENIREKIENGEGERRNLSAGCERPALEIWRVTPTNIFHEGPHRSKNRTILRHAQDKWGTCVNSAPRPCARGVHFGDGVAREVVQIIHGAARRRPPNPETQCVCTRNQGCTTKQPTLLARRSRRRHQITAPTFF
jgi:hypothetical protein